MITLVVCLHPCESISISSVSLLKKLEAERFSESSFVDAKFAFNTESGLESEGEEELDILALHSICDDLVDGLSEEDNEETLLLSTQGTKKLSSKRKKKKIIKKFHNERYFLEL